MIEGPWQAEQVERQVQELAGRYEAGDAHDRLALWLQHRDLRPLLSRLEKDLQA